MEADMDNARNSKKPISTRNTKFDGVSTPDREARAMTGFGKIASIKRTAAPENHSIVRYRSSPLHLI